MNNQGYTWIYSVTPARRAWQVQPAKSAGWCPRSSAA